MYVSINLSNYILTFFLRFCLYFFFFLIFWYLYSTLLISDVSFLNFLFYIFWRFFDLFYFFLINFFFLNFLIITSWLITLQFIFNIYFLNLTKFINVIFFEQLFYKDIFLFSKKNYVNSELFYNFNKNAFNISYISVLNKLPLNSTLIKYFYNLNLQLLNTNIIVKNSIIFNPIFFFIHNKTKVSNLTNTSFLLLNNFKKNKHYLLSNFYKLNTLSSFFFFNPLLIHFLENLKTSRWLFLESSFNNADLLLFKNFNFFGFQKNKNMINISNINLLKTYSNFENSFESFFFRNNFLHNNSFSSFYNFPTLYLENVQNTLLFNSTNKHFLNFSLYTLFNTRDIHTTASFQRHFTNANTNNLSNFFILSKNIFSFFKDFDLNFYYLFSTEPAYLLQYNPRCYFIYRMKDDYIFLYNKIIFKDISYLN